MGVLVDETPLAVDGPPELTLLLDDARTALAEGHPGTAELPERVRFGGLTPRQAGAALGLARRDADAKCAFARAFLARGSSE